MTLTRKLLLAAAGVAALASVTAGAAAEDWDYFGFWTPQAAYVSHDDGDRYQSYGYDGGDRSYRSNDAYRGYTRTYGDNRYGHGSYNGNYYGAYGANRSYSEYRGQSRDGYGYGRDRQYSHQDWDDNTDRDGD